MHEYRLSLLSAPATQPAVERPLPGQKRLRAASTRRAHHRRRRALALADENTQALGSRRESQTSTLLETRTYLAQLVPYDLGGTLHTLLLVYVAGDFEAVAPIQEMPCSPCAFRASWIRPPTTMMSVLAVLFPVPSCCCSPLATTQRAREHAGQRVRHACSADLHHPGVSSKACSRPGRRTHDDRRRLVQADAGYRGRVAASRARLRGARPAMVRRPRSSRLLPLHRARDARQRVATGERHRHVGVVFILYGWPPACASPNIVSAPSCSMRTGEACAPHFDVPLHVPVRNKLLWRRLRRLTCAMSPSRRGTTRSNGLNLGVQHHRRRRCRRGRRRR